jgi:hypothetical protein
MFLSTSYIKLKDANTSTNFLIYLVRTHQIRFKLTLQNNGSVLSC